MNSCQSKPLKRSHIESNFRSSYNRSYEYKNVVDLPLSHVRIKRETRKDLRTPVMQERSLSSYNATFGMKNRDFMKDSDYYPRSSVNSRPNLRRLYEENVGNPPKPHEFGLTTTGTTHKALKPISTPQSLLSDYPEKEYTSSIQVVGKNEFSFIAPNENSSYKLLDNFVSTTRLTHTDFSEEQRNGIAKRDVITYYDAVGVPKCRGTQMSIHFGPYFGKHPKSLYRQFPNQFFRVPHSGSTSTYKKDFKHITSNLAQSEHNIEFPVQYKLTKGDILIAPGMYCTEKCHLGTGWPVRAVFDVGRVRDKF